MVSRVAKAGQCHLIFIVDPEEVSNLENPVHDKIKTDHHKILSNFQCADSACVSRVDQKIPPKAAGAVLVGFQKQTRRRGYFTFITPFIMAQWPG